MDLRTFMRQQVRAIRLWRYDNLDQYWKRNARERQQVNQ